jgi:predicted MPP superfamily phosphohydrolase
VQLSDIHWDPSYVSSVNSNKYCHESAFERRIDILPFYGDIGSACDSPTSLVNATFDFLKQNMSKVGAVFITGDFARHNRDGDLPRTRDEVVYQIKTIVERIVDTFDSKTIIAPYVLSYIVLLEIGIQKLFPHLNEGIFLNYTNYGSLCGQTIIAKLSLILLFQAATISCTQIMKRQLLD